MNKRIISRFLDDLWWICFVVERSHLFLRKLLPSFGIDIPRCSHVLFSGTPATPAMDEPNGSWRVDGTGRMKRTERTVQVVSPTVGFFSPYSKRVFYQTYRSSWIPCPKNLSKNLDPTFPEWMWIFFLWEISKLPRILHGGRSAAKSVKTVGCPVGFRSIFSKKKRSAMSLRWCKQSCTYWICMRAFVHTFVEQFLNLQYSAANY